MNNWKIAAQGLIGPYQPIIPSEILDVYNSAANTQQMPPRTPFQPKNIKEIKSEAINKALNTTKKWLPSSSELQAEADLAEKELGPASLLFSESAPIAKGVGAPSWVTNDILKRQNLIGQGMWKAMPYLPGGQVSQWETQTPIYQDYVAPSLNWTQNTLDSLVQNGAHALTHPTSFFGNLFGDGNSSSQTGPVSSFPVTSRTNNSKQNWAGIMAKAQRLRLTDGVHVEEKEDGYTSGTVEGDHGTYHVKMMSHDPYSGVIDEWQCECPWFQYAFDRTEKYQKFEGRFCSHALALYWQAAVEEPTKTPEEAAPEEERDEKPVVEEELKWEMEEPEVAEEIALEDPERLAPREIEGPKVVSEVAPPSEPFEQETQESVSEYPVNYETQPEPQQNWKEPQLEDENKELLLRNSKTASIQDMRDIKNIKDALEKIKGKL